MGNSNNGVWIWLQYISVLLITVALVWLLVDELTAVLVIAICWIIFLPAFVVAVISLFGSLRLNTRNKRILSGLHFVNAVLLCIWLFYPGTKCDADIMEKHYLKYGKRMEEVYCKLYETLTPGCYVEIEFERGKVSIFHFAGSGEKPDTVQDSSAVIPVYRLPGGLAEIEQNWNPGEEKVDSLLSACGLDRKSLKELQEGLKDAGCISIAMKAEPDGPFVLGFRRIGLGMYSYKIFHQPLSPEEQRELNGWDTDIVFSPYVVFEYAGGAVGTQHFIGKEEYLERKGSP